ncbi:MAG: hypothetical protein R2682_05265 [Pyrinomonadaceae bacterium]
MFSVRNAPSVTAEREASVHFFEIYLTSDNPKLELLAKEGEKYAIGKDSNGAIAVSLLSELSKLVAAARSSTELATLHGKARNYLLRHSTTAISHRQTRKDAVKP